MLLTRKKGPLQSGSDDILKLVDFTGCKKEKAKDAPGVEESSEEDVSEDEATEE